MRFSHSFIVGKGDIDVHDHVNNVAYLRWIQDVAVAHWQAAASARQQADYTWYVLRHEIDYKDRAFEGDAIRAETWVETQTRIKCERTTEIRRGDCLLVKAKSIWCLFDAKTNRPAKISDELRSIFENK
ncbi:MAG: thioesterase family protein [Acidobacteria bacterium]|nr:thioesterase family protein [Acidobacteriota bacterium]